MAGAPGLDAVGLIKKPLLIGGLISECDTGLLKCTGAILIRDGLPVAHHERLINRTFPYGNSLYFQENRPFSLPPCIDMPKWRVS